MPLFSPKELLRAIEQVTPNSKEQNRLIDAFEREWTVAVRNWRQKHDRTTAAQVRATINSL